MNNSRKFKEDSLIRIPIGFVSEGYKIQGKFYLGGFNIGIGTTHSLNVSKGKATTYGGIVGSIDAENFAANQYSFGLFTYLQADPVSGAEFEVINYWVE